MNDFTSAEEIAEKLGISRKQFLQTIARDPTFPPRITVSRKAFCWETAPVAAWLKSHRDKKPEITILD